MNSCFACFQPTLSPVGLCAAIALPSQTVCGAGVTCCGGTSTVTVTAKRSTVSPLLLLAGLGLLIYIGTRRR